MAEAFKKCKIDGCQGNSHYARHGRKGFCSSHYSRLKSHGDPLLGRAREGEALSFLLEVALPYRGDECLPWPYSCNGEGYGVITIDGAKQLASRYLCEMTSGPAPTSGHQAAHECGNGHLGCINPLHISWKTRIENESDKVKHGTTLRGERHPLSKLCEEDVIEILNLSKSMSQTELSKRYSVSQSVISLIISGKRWPHLSEGLRRNANQITVS